MIHAFRCFLTTSVAIFFLLGSNQILKAEVSTFSDSSSFDASFTTLTTVDFDSTSVASETSQACATSISSTSNDACFTPGQIASGIVIADTPGPDANGVQVVGSLNAFSITTPTVAPSAEADFLNLTFPNNDVQAVGFDLYAFDVGGTTCEIDVFGAGDTLIHESSLSCGINKIFFGIASDEVITRVRIAVEEDTTPEIIDNVRFGTSTADLSITKSNNLDGNGISGESVTYTITVTNNGPDTAQDINVTDTLPAGITYVSNSCGGSISDGTQVSLGTAFLTNGSTFTCEVQGTINDSANGTIENNASVATDSTDSDNSNDNASSSIEIRPELTVSLTGQIKKKKGKLSLEANITETESGVAYNVSNDQCVLNFLVGSSNKQQDPTPEFTQITSASVSGTGISIDAKKMSVLKKGKKDFRLAHLKLELSCAEFSAVESDTVQFKAITKGFKPAKFNRWVKKLTKKIDKALQN